MWGIAAVIIAVTVIIKIVINRTGTKITHDTAATHRSNTDPFNPSSPYYDIDNKS